MKDRTDPTNRDTVPAMLTPGEFVINKEATQMYGDQLKTMNNNGLAVRAQRNSMAVPQVRGSIPQFNEGGEAKGNWWTNMVGSSEYWDKKNQEASARNAESIRTGEPTHSPREIMSFLPVIGDAIAAEEVYNEVSKPNPNWLLVGALSGATAVGLIPGIGPAASALIKKGARAGLSGIKAVPRIRPRPYDPSRMGMNDAVYLQSENVGRRDFHPVFNEKTGKYDGGVSMEDRQAFINHRAQQTRDALQKEGLTSSQQKLLDEYNESVAKFDKAVSEGKGSLFSPSQVMKKPDFNIGVTRHTTGTDVPFDADSFNYRPIAINKSGAGEGDFIFTSNLDDNYDSVFAAKSGGIPLHLLPESQQTLHKNMMAYKLDSDRNFIKDAAGNKIPKIRYNAAGEELSNIPIKQPYVYNVAYNENPRPTRSGFMDTQTNLKEIAVPDVNVRRIDRVWPPNPDDWDTFWKNNYNTGGLVTFLKDKEGYGAIGATGADKNKAYKDVGGVWTIGYGRTFNDDGSKVKEGDTSTSKKENAWLSTRAEEEYDAVKKFSDDEGYGWNQNQLEAFASFRYNNGPKGFEQLAHKNTGNPGFADVPEDPGYDIRYNRSTQEMVDKMPLYKNVDGKEVAGLVARRAAEVDLAGPVPYDKRYQGWQMPAPQEPSGFTRMLQTIGKGEAMKGKKIPGYNEGGMPMEDDDIMNFIKNYQGKLGDVNPEDVGNIVTDEDLLRNSSDYIAGPNNNEEAFMMQYGNPRTSIPIPGGLHMTDSAQLRGGNVRPDMMPPGYVPKRSDMELMSNSWNDYYSAANKREDELALQNFESKGMGSLPPPPKPVKEIIKNDEGWWNEFDELVRPGATPVNLGLVDGKNKLGQTVVDMNQQALLDKLTELDNGSPEDQAYAAELRKDLDPNIYGKNVMTVQGDVPINTKYGFDPSAISNIENTSNVSGGGDLSTIKQMESRIDELIRKQDSAESADDFMKYTNSIKKLER